MIRSHRFLSLVGVSFALGLAALACSGGSGPLVSGSSSSSSSSGGSEQEPTPQEQVTVSPPSTALEVTATIVSATLGDECGGGAGEGKFAPSDCAPTDGGQCGSICRESNVQLSFKTGAGSAAKVEITSVTLHDSKTGAKVDTLQASSPQSWNGSGYAAWDETLAPSSEIKASYDLTAPKWSAMGTGANLYSATYRLRVALKIDGVAVLLESAELSREPAVAT